MLQQYAAEDDIREEIELYSTGYGIVLSANVGKDTYSGFYIHLGPQRNFGPPPGDSRPKLVLCANVIEKRNICCC